MLKGFRDFIMRGNVIDLAVAVVIGAAFNTVVQSLVKDVITPLIAAVAGKPDFSGVGFDVNGTHVPIGNFINALVSFLLVAAAVYYAVVLPMNTAFAKLQHRPRHQALPGVRQRYPGGSEALQILRSADRLAGRLKKLDFLNVVQ